MPSSQPPKHGATDTADAGTPAWSVVDLGSNTFCLMQGRVRDGRVEVTRCLRESVRLVAGVDDEGRLDASRRGAAMQCLARFGIFTRDQPAVMVRPVATSAIRRLARPRDFLQAAAARLGHEVDLVGGHEEARLTWLGAVSTLPASNARRVVVDIGGGSTECMHGCGRQLQRVASIDIGCVVASRQFFPRGRISAQRWQRALRDMRKQLASHLPAAPDTGIEAWATSGSARIIGATVHALGTAPAGTITRAAIEDLRQRLLRAGHVKHIDLPGIDANSAKVLPGSLAVLHSLFLALDLQQAGLCESAMREGVILELASRA